VADEGLVHRVVEGVEGSDVRACEQQVCESGVDVAGEFAPANGPVDDHREVGPFGGQETGCQVGGLFANTDRWPAWLAGGVSSDLAGHDPVVAAF
jgi:hypothetical protein